MLMSDMYIKTQLSKAQQLLWSGSLHEVDEAHNIVAKLLSDLGVDELPDDVVESDQGEE